MIPRRASRLLPPLAVALLVHFAGAAQAAPASSCTSAQHASRVAALKTYEHALPRARAAYFEHHASATARARFAKAQKAKLAGLEAAASCTVAGTGGTLPEPLPAPAPTANEHFVFEDAISAEDRKTIEDDVAYAVADEQSLTGASFGDVNVFVGATPSWLAEKDCGFYGYVGECVAQKTQEFGSGAAEGGYRALFVSWRGPQAGAPETQKVIAHELFHVFQYEVSNLPNEQTPSSGVRILGPVWLHEGAAEMVGYHVLGDRHLGYSTYPNLLLTEKGKARAPAPPLEQLQSVDQDRAAGSPYALYMVAVDHLSAIAGGVPALAAYHRALAAGQPWPDAFAGAFGMSVDAYYASFAAYRAGL